MIVYHVATELVVEKMSRHMSRKQIEQNSTIGTLMVVRISSLLHRILRMMNNSMIVMNTNMWQFTWRASMSSFSSLACNCHRKSSRAIHSTYEYDDGDNDDDEEEEEEDLNLATMKCHSDDEDNGNNRSNDMKRHLSEFGKMLISTCHDHRTC